MRINMFNSQTVINSNTKLQPGHFLNAVKEGTRLQVGVFCRSSGGVTHPALTLLPLPHTHTHMRVAVDLTRLSSAAAATGQRETMQTTNHGKAPLRGTAAAAAPLIRPGLSLTVGNNTSLRLPINPHLSPRHGVLSAVLGLLHHSSFEGAVVVAGCGEEEGCPQSGGGFALSRGSLLRQVHQSYHET